jgi:hypothetical protein
MIMANFQKLKKSKISELADKPAIDGVNLLHIVGLNPRGHAQAERLYFPPICVYLCSSVAKFFSLPRDYYYYLRIAGRDSVKWIVSPRLSKLLFLFYSHLHSHLDLINRNDSG